MNRRIFLALLISGFWPCAPLFAALTARYVTATGTDTYANSTNSATPMSLTTALANMAAGDEIWIKAGNYTARSADTPTPDGTVVSPIVLHGYSATIGDLDAPSYNADGSLVTTSFPLIEYSSGARLNASGANYIIYRNLKVGVAGTGFSGAVMNLGTNSTVVNSYVYNPSTNSAATAITLTGANGIVENSDVTLTGSSAGPGAISITASCRVIKCRVLDAPAGSAGISLITSASDCLILNNVFFVDVAGPCIENLSTSTSASITVVGNTAKGQTHFYRSAAATYTALAYFADNHATDLSTAGFLSLQDATSQIPAIFSHNRFRDNGVNIDGWDNWAAGSSFRHVTTDTGGPETDYTNAAANQFRLILGAPGAGAGSVANRDIGALQRAASGGSASAFTWAQ